MNLSIRLTWVVAAGLLGSADCQVFRRAPYEVSVSASPPPHDGASPIIDLAITDLKSGARSTLRIENYTASIDEVFTPGPGKLVMIGELNPGHTLSVIDSISPKLLDTVWTWDIAVSPSKRYVAYAFRYPPHGLPQSRNDVLLLYDCLLPPNMIPRKQDDNASKGFILYREENRVAHRYTLRNDQEYDERFSSPIRWSQKGNSVGLLESRGGQTRFVLVDLTGGPRSPKISKWKVDESLFLDPSPQGIPSKYKGGSLTASSLAFKDDDSAVVITSVASGPFRQATVRLSLSNGSQTIVKVAPGP